MVVEICSVTNVQKESNNFDFDKIKILGVSKKWYKKFMSMVSNEAFFFKITSNYLRIVFVVWPIKGNRRLLLKNFIKS